MERVNVLVADDDTGKADTIWHYARELQESHPDLFPGLPSKIREEEDLFINIITAETVQATKDALDAAVKPFDIVTVDTMMPLKDLGSEWPSDMSPTLVDLYNNYGYDREQMLGLTDDSYHMLLLSQGIVNFSPSWKNSDKSHNYNYLWFILKQYLKNNPNEALEGFINQAISTHNSERRKESEAEVQKYLAEWKEAEEKLPTSARPNRLKRKIKHRLSIVMSRYNESFSVGEVLSWDQWKSYADRLKSVVTDVYEEDPFISHVGLLD